MSGLADAGGTLTFLPSKADEVIRKGDIYGFWAAGGGGFGDPRLRPAEKVADDVRQGYVSVESAARDYCVICDAAGRLDVEATESARADVPAA